MEDNLEIRTKTVPRVTSRLSSTTTFGYRKLPPISQQRITKVPVFHDLRQQSFQVSGTLRSAPHLPLKILSEGASLKNTCEFNIKDHVYEAQRVKAKATPTLDTKKWDFPFDTISSDGFFKAILQNEAVRHSEPSGFINSSLVSELLIKSGMAQTCKELGLSGTSFHGLLEYTFFEVSSGRIRMSDELCMTDFFRKLAIALRREMPFCPMTARKLWHMMVSAIFFMECRPYMSSHEEAKKYAIRLSKDFLKKQEKDVLLRKHLFLKE